MLAATHLDPVIGIDVHIIQPPPPAPPIPVPHPYVGIVFDPFDYAPVIGSTVVVNGMHRAIAGTAGKAVPPHIPIGGTFVKPPLNEDENFMGSMTVEFDGDAAAYATLPCISCSCVGTIAPVRPNPKKKSKLDSLVLPTSVVLPIPKGPPVLIGGPPTISLTNIAMSAGMAGLGRGLRRLARSGAAKKGLAAFKRARQRVFRNMDPGFLRCQVLRAEPVDSVTGEVVVDQLDFELPGRLPLRWTRHYRSGSTRRGWCGEGWETPADARLTLGERGEVLFHDGTGVAAFFDGVPGSRPILELTNGAALDRSEDHLRVRLKNGRSYWFPLHAPRREPNEIVVSVIEDRDGNWWNFVRNKEGLAAIADNAGRRIEVVSKGGLVREMSLRQPGEEPRPLCRLAYDAGGGLVSVDDPLAAPYRFGYREGRLVRHMDRNGLSFHYEYDEHSPSGRVARTWGDGGLYDYRFVYDPENRWTEVTDSQGQVSVVEYDERLMIVRETDPLGRVTAYAYDDAGRTIEVVDPVGRLTSYDYDDRGNLVSLGRPDGATLVTEYDRDSNPVRQVDAAGHAWHMEWDANGHLASRTSPRGGTWRYRHAVSGDLAFITDPKGARTRFEYDARGLVSAIVDPLGNRQDFAFDALGKITAHRDGEGHVTRYEHDAKGRLTRVTSPKGAVTAYEYDPQDYLTAMVDANGHATRFRYFGLGEVSERHQPDGTVVRYDYDAEERLTAVINEAGERYELRRDALGRVVEEIDYWGNSKWYEYDRAGNVVLTRDALNRVIRFEHDALDRMVARRFEDGGEETFAYDPNGNLTAAINATIDVTRAYDADGGR